MDTERASPRYADIDLWEPTDILHAMGHAYGELLESHRDYLILQHQAYAACADEEIRPRVRA